MERSMVLKKVTGPALEVDGDEEDQGLDWGISSDPKWVAAAEKAAEGGAWWVRSDPGDPEPSTVVEALQSLMAKERKEALDKEIVTMVDRGVWDPGPGEPPLGRQAMDSKVILNKKKDNSGHRSAGVSRTEGG